MTLSRCIPLVLFVMISCSSDAPVFAQRAKIGHRLASSIDMAILEEMSKQKVVGMAIGVIQNNRVIYTNGYGFSDREAEIPVTAETMFRWASVSKPITAIAALQLYDRKKLDLEQDVRHYVPEFPDKEAMITVRQLLCHQGGIVHYANGPVIRTQRAYEQEYPFEDVILALDTFKDSPLVASPGEKYSYSSHGYILLSAVVERAGEQPFAQQVREQISKPLRLQTLQPDYQWRDIPYRSKGYRKKNGKIVESTNTDVSWKLGGGGFISTIEDMARFAAAVSQGKLIRPKTSQALATPQRTNSGEATSFGLGFSVSGEGRKLKIAHSGSQEKAATRLILYPNRKSGVVIMCNSEHANPGRFSTKVFSMIAKSK